VLFLRMKSAGEVGSLTVHWKMRGKGRGQRIFNQGGHDAFSMAQKEKYEQGHDTPPSEKERRQEEGKDV